MFLRNIPSSFTLRSFSIVERDVIPYYRGGMCENEMVREPFGIQFVKQQKKQGPNQSCPAWNLLVGRL
jgi:hypothetical protein